jgi:hypothetical protein
MTRLRTIDKYVIMYHMIEKNSNSEPGALYAVPDETIAESDSSVGALSDDQISALVALLSTPESEALRLRFFGLDSEDAITREGVVGIFDVRHKAQHNRIQMIGVKALEELHSPLTSRSLWPE